MESYSNGKHASMYFCPEIIFFDESPCRLLHIWRTMHECHHFQNYVSQQLNNLTDIHKIDLSTSYHHQAAIQLESEVSCWNNSFSEAMKSQQEYVRTLCRWIQLTDYLVDDHRQSLYSSAVCRMCEQWQLALDKSPNKVQSFSWHHWFSQQFYTPTNILDIVTTIV